MQGELSRRTSVVLASRDGHALVTPLRRLVVIKLMGSVDRKGLALRMNKHPGASREVVNISSRDFNNAVQREQTFRRDIDPPCLMCVFFAGWGGVIIE